MPSVKLVIISPKLKVKWRFIEITVSTCCYQVYFYLLAYLSVRLFVSYLTPDLTNTTHFPRAYEKLKTRQSRRNAENSRDTSVFRG